MEKFEVEENEIVEKAKNGDELAFNYLHETYKGKVYAHFMKAFANHDIADELTQKVFIKIYRNINKYNKDKSSFYKFVWLAVKQVTIDYVRSEKTNKRRFYKEMLNIYDINETNIVNEDDDKDIKEEEKKALREMMSEMSDYQRTVLKLFYFEKKSEKEIAEILGKGDGAVRSVVLRAKRNLDEMIKEKHPEIARRYGIKMVVMLAIGLTVLTGLVYATYKFYSDFISNKYTLSQLREEVPESESIITKEVALEKINYYLDVLGEEKVSIDDIKLVRNLGKGKICWMTTRQSDEIKIDSTDGKLVTYSNFNTNGITIENDISDLYEKLGLPSDYNLCRDEKLSKSRILEYSKKYGDIYNKFESVKFIVNNDKIESITTFDYPCEDTEIVISKERAMEIAEENGVEIDRIELSIENIGDKLNYSENEVYEFIDDTNYKIVELDKLSLKIKKVWKITDKNNMEFFIDVNYGKIINNSETTFAEKEE